MPISVSISSQQDLTTVQVDGLLTRDDLRPMYPYPKSTLVLWVFSDNVVVELSAEDILDVSTAATSFAIEGGKVCYVTSNDLAFGLARMYQMSSEHEENQIQYKVCRSIEEAADWLQIELPLID